MLTSLNHLKINGFTLIEVLIGLLLFSVGILAIFKLQIFTKKHLRQAVQRTIAINFASSILERMKINPDQLLTYASSSIITTASLRNEPSPTCDHLSNCNNQQLAVHDIWQFEQQIIAFGLADAKACIELLPSPGFKQTGLVTINVQWQGHYQLSTGQAGSIQSCNKLGVHPDPYRREVKISTVIVNDREL